MVKISVGRNIESGIEEVDLVLLGFTIEETQTELRWGHSREFEYNHQMYDIVELKTVNDSIYYWCWWDIAETLLNKQISDLGKYSVDNEQQKNDNKEHLNNWFKTLFFHTPGEWPVNIKSLNVSRPVLSDFFYLSPTIPPPYPPPQAV